MGRNRHSHFLTAESTPSPLGRSGGTSPQWLARSQPVGAPGSPLDNKGSMGGQLSLVSQPSCSSQQFFSRRWGLHTRPSWSIPVLYSKHATKETLWFSVSHASQERGLSVTLNIFYQFQTPPKPILPQARQTEFCAEPACAASVDVCPELAVS